MKLTVSQCARINFEGKEKIIELENLLQSERDMALELERRLAVAVEALEKCSKANERGVEHEGFRLSRIDISVWAKLALTEITKPSIPHKEEK
jgi:hypothetical protein